jgi:hypothetical protein
LVADYLRRNYPYDAATEKWVLSEIAKIKSRSPTLYKFERTAAEMDWSDDRTGEVVRLFAEAARVSEFEVRDGTALMLSLSFWEKLPEAVKRVARGADRPDGARPALAAKDGESERALSAEQRTYLRRRFPGTRPEQAIGRNARLYDASGGHRGLVNRRVGAFGAILERDRAAASQAQAAAANASRSRQQSNNNSGPNPYVLGMLLYPSGAYPGPVPYGGPFNETISRYGNQTYINGSGPYGPFNETISRYGNQTYINGFGSPYPFAPYGGLGGGY